MNSEYIKTKQSEFMKMEQRTTISLYGKTYNELKRYKKEKESTIGYRLTFQQLLALMLADIRTKKEMNRDEQRKLF